MYNLRWRFEWQDRPAKYGMWSNPGAKNDLTTKAWYHNKEGLMIASVEAKHIQTREIKTIVACDGHDFINFEWIACASLNPMGLRGAITPLTRLMGLSLITREFRYNVYQDGNLERVLRSDAEKNINYATFGR